MDDLEQKIDNFETKAIEDMCNLATKKLLDKFYDDFNRYANEELIPRIEGVVDLAVTDFTLWRIKHSVDEIEEKNDLKGIHKWKH